MGFGWHEFLTRHIGRILKQQRHVWRPSMARHFHRAGFHLPIFSHLTGSVPKIIQGQFELAYKNNTLLTFLSGHNWQIGSFGAVWRILASCFAIE